jgi:hypothetical protein
MNTFFATMTACGALLAFQSACGDSSTTQGGGLRTIAAASAGVAGMSEATGGSVGGSPAAMGGGGAGGALGAAGNGASLAGSGEQAGGGDAQGGGGTAGNGTAGNGAGGANSAGSGGSATTGCNAGFRLCDDFEADAVGAAPKGTWTVIGNNGSIVVDSVHHYSGSKAMHVLGKGSGGGGTKVDVTTQDAAVFPLPNNSVYGRMMLYLFAPWPNSHVRLMHIGNTAAASGSDGTGYALASQNGSALEFEGINDHNGAQTALPTGKWVCFEWQIAAPTGGSVTAKWWFDGIAGPAVNTGGWKNVPLQMFEIGYDIFTNANADFWVDDVVLSETRSQCPAPGSTVQ